MSLLSDIVTAIQKELKYFFLTSKGTVILDTELKEDFTCNLPLCIFSIKSAPESARLPGNGVTRMDWEFSLRIYPYEPNAYNSDDGGYSASLLSIVDDLRNHFENEQWLVQEMVSLTTNYSLRITYNGTTEAESLPLENGECVGFKHMFNTIAIDRTIESTTNMLITDEGISGDVEFT
jgi:hypothetical protein